MLHFHKVNKPCLGIMQLKMFILKGAGQLSSGNLFADREYGIAHHSVRLELW